MKNLAKLMWITTDSRGQMDKGNKKDRFQGLFFCFLKNSFHMRVIVIIRISFDAFFFI